MQPNPVCKAKNMSDFADALKLKKIVLAVKYFDDYCALGIIILD